jgi:CRISPR/Cas system-associated exonuclease Cas4 (RecB family)
MMTSAYDMDPKREVVLKEEDLHAVHETGIKLHGYPDRVERLEDGSCWIVDFKTGNNITHITNDPDTCLQGIIYAYLMEKKGYRVSGGEFRYFRKEDTVPFRYTEELKNSLYEKLTEFKTALENGDFPSVPKEEQADACKYCKYGQICVKTAAGGEEDE